MKLICPDSACPNHTPDSSFQWFDYHGSYISRGELIPRYRCRTCRRTFSQRTFSIDYWTHFHIDYQLLTSLFSSGLSLRALSRYFATSVNTIQNRIGRLARTIIPALSTLQQSIKLNEHLVADGLENFCVSQDFPNNIHLLVGKDSQYTYGFNYALMRRKGRKTAQQHERCKRIYPGVDFASHTILKAFRELTSQMMRVASDHRFFRLYTDKKEQYPLALRGNPDVQQMRAAGRFEHVTVSSTLRRTRSNNLFAVNYLDREFRKDVAEYARETVCFGRNVCNALERVCVYVFYHNFFKLYRIAVPGEKRTHAEVAGLSGEKVKEIRKEVLTKRRFLSDCGIEKGGFFHELWLRKIPTPLAKSPEYLPGYANA